MATELIQMKKQFSKIISHAASSSLGQFVIWLDLKIAEFKVNGFMLPEQNPFSIPGWLEKEIEMLADIDSSTVSFEETMSDGRLSKASPWRQPSSMKTQHTKIIYTGHQNGYKNSSNLDMCDNSRQGNRKRKRCSFPNSDKNGSSTSRMFHDTTSGTLISVDISDDERSDVHVLNHEEHDMPSSHVTSRNQSGNTSSTKCHVTHDSESKYTSTYQTAPFIQSNSENGTSMRLIENKDSYDSHRNETESFNNTCGTKLTSNCKPQAVPENLTVSPTNLPNHHKITGTNMEDEQNLHVSTDGLSNDMYIINEDESQDFKPDMETLHTAMRQTKGNTYLDHQIYGENPKLHDPTNELQPVNINMAESYDQSHDQSYDQSHDQSHGQTHDHLADVTRKELLPHVAALFEVRVLQALEDGRAAAVWNKVVSVCASHLMRSCNGKPTSLDYQSFGEVIYRAYPSIGTSKGPYPWTSFSKSLSQKIRHIRHKMRRGILVRDVDIGSLIEGQSQNQNQLVKVEQCCW